jgi:CubicO group peptidase (beta-lactamase class C family)
LLTRPTAAQGLPTAKPEDVGVSSEKVKKLSEYMQSLVDDSNIAGGVTMMARHGKVVHLEAVGMADREAGKPMQTDSIFRIASMTKPITSVAIMVLSEQGKLGLDDPVSKYIPEFENPKVLVSLDPLKTEPAKQEITIRHLLTHTSGIGYSFSATLGPIYDQHGIPCGLCRTDDSLAEVMVDLAKMPLLFHPGEQYEYGMSTDVLGRVVEVVSGMPFDRFVESQVCHPLSMHDTFFTVPPDKRSRLVAAYVPVENCLRKIKPGEILREDLGGHLVEISSDYPYVDSHEFRSGGGGLCSTPSDYMRFCQMLLNGGVLGGKRLLRRETVEMMTADQTGKLEDPDVPDQFGFGFTTFPDKPDVHEQLRGAYAWFGFWFTSFRISPRGDWIVVTMAQRSWTDDVTPEWIADYEEIAAEAIEK